MACSASGTSFIQNALTKKSIYVLFTQPEDHEARHFSFDVVLGASGKSVNLDGFKRWDLYSIFSYVLNTIYQVQVGCKTGYSNNL